MWTIIAIPTTCWLCAVVAKPRRPVPGNEVQELVYGTLLGRHQRLLLVAGTATAAAAFALLVALTQQAGGGATGRRGADVVCPDSPASPPTCYRAVAGGWQEEQLWGDGAYALVGTPLAHLPLAEKDRALAP